MSGEVLHSGIHGGFIFDSACKGHGLLIQISKSAEGHPDLIAFQDAIFGKGCFGTLGKEIRATFSGQFIWKPHKKVGMYSIEIDRVENLYVNVVPGICDNRQ